MQKIHYRVHHRTGSWTKHRKFWFVKKKDRLPLVKNWKMNVYLFSRRERLLFENQWKNFQHTKRRKFNFSIWIRLRPSWYPRKELCTISSLLEREEFRISSFWSFFFFFFLWSVSMARDVWQLVGKVIHIDDHYPISRRNPLSFTSFTFRTGRLKP